MSTKAEKKAVTETAKKNLMYVGPSITGVIRHSTVFKDGVLPEKVNNCIKEFPAMRKLFVEIGTAAAAIKEINKEQSALKSICNQVKNKFK